MNIENIRQLPELIQELYKLISKIHEKFPDWEFTPDGRLVGDIGEAFACYYFDLVLLSRNNKTHDAKAPNGRLVQIKATQQDTLGLGLERRNFEHLIALRINSKGKARVIYNGSGARVWKELGNIKSASIGVRRLRHLNKTVPATERLKRIK